MSIEWLPWGEAAFARGRALGRPLLLSLTASWCHACHRMDEETWDDPAVSAAVGRAAVPVRVDADERPDVYARYHLGGLPTTALLGDGGEFIRGGTFLLPAALLRLLDLSLADWRAGRRPAPRPASAPALAGDLADAVVARLLRRADPEHGGFGMAPKLAETHALTLLLRRWRACREPGIERVIARALGAIAAHLADPRDGGFFRYAAGPDWSGPRTEKVAVDQALIAGLLLEAGAALGEPRWVELARAGLAHARRRLADREGRVLASVAADPAYYAAAPAPEDMPPVDGRRFADGGAAMAWAASLALAVTGEDLGVRSEYRASAPGGCLPHRLDAPGGVRGLLRDQALGCAAALAEYRLRGDPALLDWARRAADWALGHLWDEAAGAFRDAPPDGEQNAGTRLPPIHPLLANGEMAQALLDLAAHSGARSYRETAARVVAALGPRAALSPAGPALALAAMALAGPGAEADLAGDPADPRARELARAVVAALGPAAVVRWARAPGARASVTLCAGDLCLPAAADARELLEALADVDLVPRGILTSWSG